MRATCAPQHACRSEMRADRRVHVGAHVHVGAQGASGSTWPGEGPGSKEAPTLGKGAKERLRWPSAQAAPPSRVVALHTATPPAQPLLSLFFLLIFALTAPPGAGVVALTSLKTTSLQPAWMRSLAHSLHGNCTGSKRAQALSHTCSHCALVEGVWGWGLAAYG